MSTKRNNPETIAIHGGDYRSDPSTNAVAVPCLLYTSPSPRDSWASRMPSSAWKKKKKKTKTRIHTKTIKYRNAQKHIKQLA